MQIFNFRDGHVTTFRHPSGAYICQIPGHRLSRLAKATPSSVPLVCGKTVSCRLCAGQSKGTIKPEKCCFGIWLLPRYKISEFFTIAPVLTSTLTVCRRNRCDPSSRLRVRYKYYKTHSRSRLAWSRSRTDRDLSRPTSVFRKTISVCKILSRSVAIWQYEGQKPVLGVKAENAQKQNSTWAGTLEIV